MAEECVTNVTILKHGSDSTEIYFNVFDVIAWLRRLAPETPVKDAADYLQTCWEGAIETFREREANGEDT